MARPAGASPRASATSGWAREAAESPFLRGAARELCTLAAGVGVVVATVFAMGAVFSASPSRRQVDRAACDCTCWDGAFKNGYNTAGYKTSHFSFDERLPWLMAWVAAAILLATSLVRHVVKTAVSGAARIPLLIAIIVQLYPNHYGFWSAFNYINEGIWGFMAVQVLFTATEVASTAVAAAHLNSGTPLEPRALWIIIGVAGLHVFHNTIDWTTSNIGMPLMLVADFIQAGVAGAYIASCVGAATPSGAAGAGSAQFGVATGACFSGMKSGVTASSVSDSVVDDDVEVAPGGRRARVAPVPYTARAAQVDAGITLAAIVALSVALHLWQGVAHTIASSSESA
jgi:hypothetical protein